MRFILKKNVHFVRFEGSVALFIVFGQRLLFKHDDVSLLPDLWEALISRPFLGPEDFRKFEQDRALKTGKIQELIELLFEKGLLLKSMNQEDSVATEIVVSPKLLSLLEQVTSSVAAIRTLVDKLAKTELTFISDKKIEKGLLSLVEFGFDREKMKTVNLDQACNLSFSPTEKIVVLTSDGQGPLFAELNKKLFAQKKDWLWVHTDPYGFTVGPLFGPTAEFCLECLEKRRKANLEQPEKWDWVREFKLEPSLINQDLDLSFPFASSLWNFVGIELIKISTGLWPTELYRGQQSWDNLNHVSEFHDILPLPYCEVCSPQLENPPQTLARFI